MMGLATIQSMNQEKAEEAAREGKRPYFVEVGDSIEPPFPVKVTEEMIQ